MATNYISRFGEKTQTQYAKDLGIRYSDTYWESLNNNDSYRKKGFLPNTPMSSIIFNTVLTQTSFVSYIVGEVLASGVVKDETGKSLINKNISVEDIDAEIDIISPITTFLNRINNITGINNKDGSEITWRARQLGSQTIENGEIKHSDYYWSVAYTTGTLIPSKNTQGIITKYIRGIYDKSAQITFKESKDSRYIQVDNTSKVVTQNVDINGKVNISTNNIEIKSTDVNSKCSLVVNNGDIVLSSGCDIQMYTRYNADGSTTDTSYHQYLLGDTLVDIAQRLDKLGYMEGSISFAGITYNNCIHRQGNYVFCNITLKNNFSSQLLKYFAKDKVLFTVPENFAPNNNVVLYISVTSDDSYEGDIRVVTLDTSGNGTVTAAYGNAITAYNDIVTIPLNFGYEASPRT